MCLIAWALHTHPDHPLLLVANRDEFHARPTLAADWWENAPDIFAGRDLEAGGTWLGVNRQGRLAAVTNFREPAGQAAEPAGGFRSRGELTRAFLDGSTTMDDYLSGLQETAGAYRGYNLLLWERGRMAWFSNRSPAGLELQAGVHTLSNGLLGTPWPKTRLAASHLGELLGKPVAAEELLAVTADRRIAGDADLPSTGITTELERMLSASFIVSERYGTRSSTALMVDRAGTLSFTEQGFDAEGKKAERRELTLAGWL